MRKNAARISWRMTLFISLPSLLRSASIGCATRSYKTRETSDHALSATCGSRGSVLSTLASYLDPRLPQTSPQGILRGVVYRVALSRPSVIERTWFQPTTR
jgi:hypothetical protein